MNRFLSRHLQFSPQTPEVVHPVDSLKVLSYNIHSAIGRDKKYRLDRIIHILKKERADIIALQEVDNRLKRSEFQHQSTLIASALGMNYHHCVISERDGGEWGVTTLSRLPVIQNRKHDLSYRQVKPTRGSLHTEIACHNGMRLHIFNVHLGLRTRERTYQRKRLLSQSMLLDDALRDPIIILGDFNDRPIPVVHRQLGRHFTDVTQSQYGRSHATFAWGPMRFRLDYIYISNDLNVLDTYVVKNRHTRVASDHLPVVSVIKLPLF